MSSERESGLRPEFSSSCLLSLTSRANSTLIRFAALLARNLVSDVLCDSKALIVLSKKSEDILEITEKTQDSDEIEIGSE